MMNGHINNNIVTYELLWNEFKASYFWHIVIETIVAILEDTSTGCAISVVGCYYVYNIAQQ